MTVTNENSRNDYVSNGSAVEYAFTFKILDEQDLQVIVLNLNGVEEVLTLTTDYAVSLDADTGLGHITLVNAVTAGFGISLLRNMDFEQNTSIQNQGTSQFSGKSFEQALDKLTLLALQLKENIARSILLPKSSQLTELEIPVNLANAGKAVIVNAAGDNLEVRNLMDISAAAFSALGLELVNTATAAAMRTLLGVQALNATLTDLAARVVGNSSGNIPVVGSQSASTSLAGLVELLTNAELAAATDTTRAATAAAIASLFSNSTLANPGAIYIPVLRNGIFEKLIVQLGNYTSAVPAGGSVDITLPVTFPTAFLIAICCPAAAAYSGDGNALGTTKVSNSVLRINNGSLGNAGNTGAAWLAIGY
jgi:hypothetical protein